MACPHLREVVMLFCDACPVKKMIPLTRIATADPCLGEFHGCPLFKDYCPSAPHAVVGAAQSAPDTCVPGKDTQR